MAVKKASVEKVAEKIETLVWKLQEMTDQKQEALDNAESKDYPNQERIEKLQEQVYILQQAHDDIENALSDLNNYE
jgi:hypothetical protein